MARILVIDDEAPIRAVLQHILERSGHEVAAVTDGPQGVLRLVEHPTDLVIIDIFMPEKEGIGTIMELRQQSPQTKVVAITSYGQGDNPDFLATAAHYKLAKPFGRQELLDAVNTALA